MVRNAASRRSRGLPVRPGLGIGFFVRAAAGYSLRMRFDGVLGCPSDHALRVLALWRPVAPQQIFFDPAGASGL